MSSEWIALSGVWLVAAIASFAIIALAYSAGHRAGYMDGFMDGWDDAMGADAWVDGE